MVMAAEGVNQRALFELRCHGDFLAGVSRFKLDSPFENALWGAADYGELGLSGR